MRMRPLPSACGTNGFTLLEMMITLAIFLLLAAAVFGILTGVLQTSSSLQDNQNRRDQTVSLNAFLKKKLGEMSAQSVLISYKRGDGEGLLQNGIIFGQDEMVTAIDAKIQANGYYTLRFAAYDPAMMPNGSSASPETIFYDAIANDNTSVNWKPLIRDIKTLDWKFQDLNSTQWFDQWSNAGAKPNLVEFSMQGAGDLQPSTMDFWIPRIAPVSIVIPPQPTTPPATPPATHAP